MQVELLRDIEPPSYEESIYFKQLVGQIKAQRRKTPPPSYDNNGVFDVFKRTQLLDKKCSTPSVIEKSIPALSTEESHDDENQQDSSMDERLERVSSYLQQMIDAANQSLTSSSSPENSETIDDDEEMNVVLPKEQKQQWRINRQKSLERLKSSQDSLAQTIDKLNLSITQHIIDKEASYDYTQHHFYHQYISNLPRKSKISLWTHVLTQLALVYGICHQLLSWSTSTSSIISVAWFVTMLLVKKKFNHGKLGLFASTSSTSIMTIKSFLLPQYSSILSLFRKQ